ncbi:hypothetical protein HIM_10548 [Hirsutella minnesotensis 3608]|uniref:O-methyltransferase C-terminal domain-containing protein n=1 Tax=Hirsutella minnesotensis 3608 TaxID=1043627 RepID=A0A0F7ZJY5_9HYPO|nr:hypothetical protein HIM_10548 [Hirsutella minnesotensis 3608]
MAHDIFSPQPVKEAQVYLMRRLLNDFPDEAVSEILQNTKAAMGTDSRLLISEVMLPESVVPGEHAASHWLNFAAMAIGGRVRTVQEYKALLDEAGLAVENVYTCVGQCMMVEAKSK